MDHHCPWTSNCVSHTTLPHFLRFVLYTVISLILLMYYLCVRFRAIWHARNLPSYLGPSIGAITHLLILTFITALLLFALTILLVTAANSLLTNTTMIEAWEIERHTSLVDRSRYLGGYVQGPGGRRVRIVKQEFPYDIGFWKNLVQGMGSKNVLAWFLPFGGAPENKSAWGPWEENGFEDPGVRWPPVDPDKLSGTADWKREMREGDRYLSTHSVDDGEDEVQAFRRRQEADYRRWESSRRENSKSGSRLRTSEAGSGVEFEDEDCSGEDLEQDEYEEGIDGNPGWTSSEGNRLRDFGVDEEAEVIVSDDGDEDDIPLGVLLRRRREQRPVGGLVVD
jgi:palmitoyltransferase